MEEILKTNFLQQTRQQMQLYFLRKTVHFKDFEVVYLFT